MPDQIQSNENMSYSSVIMKLSHSFIMSTLQAYEGQVHLFINNTIINKQIRSAKLYSTALGMYEVELNAAKVGDAMFLPTFTHYKKRLCYQEYDITKMLKEGNNKIEIYLADGWYKGRFTYKNICNIYGNEAAVSLIMEILYTDGTIDVISTDDSWLEVMDHPYIRASWYDGEVYDSTKRCKETIPVKVFHGEIPSLEETYIEVKQQEEISVKEVIQKDNYTIVDFGQNFAGIVEINSLYLTNQTVTIRHGEILD